MERRNRSNLLKLFGSGFLVLLGACGQIGGSGQCGGVEDSGACVIIEDIQPTYESGGGNTSDVDARQDLCTNVSTGEVTDIEPFTDHSASVTISNNSLPGGNANLTPDVTLTNYTIVYSLNSCPSGESCPDLEPVSVSQTLFIPANGNLTTTLKFVDLAKKAEYSDGVSSLLIYPSYTATYTFSGTDIFNNKVAISGAAEFTIGDYDNCQ